MLEYIFKAFLLTSLIGTALTLLLIAIKPITRKFLSSKMHYYLWLVVLVAMIVPFRFAEQVSQQPNDNITIYSPIQESFHSEFNEMVGESNDNQTGIIDFLKSFADAQMQTIAMIWIAGACLMFLSKLLSYGLFMVELRKNSEVISCPELKRFTDKNIITRAGDKFSSPLMVGVFRPILLLPKVSMTEEQLNNVLSHEMIHYRRKDILYKWFVCLVKCIHWFNPAIYYVSNQIDIECEISCDAAVVKNMSDEEQTRYIDTIITLLAAGNKKQLTITTGMVSDKKTLQRRFTMIKNKIKMSKKTVIIVAVLTLAIVGCTVFASGVLNGNLIDEPEDEIVQQTSKEPKLEKIETETGEIVYDKENGEVVSATSEPKLVAAGETDADPQQQKLPRIEKETSEKATNTEIVVDASENSSTGPVLKEIEFDADFESNPVQGEVSMNFGKREHPITKEVKEHNGIDIKAPEGTKVVSSINGTVTDVGFDAEKGNYIIIENGNLKTLYAQLATTNVKKGDKITAKQSIGTVGKTGKATGAHLHFEMMVDGEYVDPVAYIK